MNRITLGLSYNGANYHGWQSQGDGVATVQDVVESAVSQVADEPVRLICAGRTDTGVHATHQIVHFDTLAQRPLKAWVYGCNALLPDSVSVNFAAPVPADFSARFTASARRYLYIVFNRSVRSALFPEYLTREHRPLDETAMHEAAQYLIGEHDFSSFRAANCQSRTPMRNVSRVSVFRLAELVLIDITANAFLHHMVRNIAGVLLDIGAGEKPVTWTQELLQLRDRSKAARTAPPNGLYLVGVFYPGVDLPTQTWPPFLVQLPQLSG